MCIATNGDGVPRAYSVNTVCRMRTVVESVWNPIQSEGNDRITNLLLENSCHFEWKPTMPFERLRFISRSDGSLGKLYVLHSMVKESYPIDLHGHLPG